MTGAQPLGGVIPAMVTPATDDASDVDYARAKSLARRLIDSGVHGLFPCGSTGEAPLLDREQRIRLIDAIAEENARKLPLMVGVGAMSTRHAVQFAKDAEAHGATHAAILPLHLFRASEDELETYFATVADSVSIPSVLYNFPLITSHQNISPELAATLAQKHDIVGIKDSGGDMAQALHYINVCAPDFAVFTGCDPLLLPLLQHGGAGTICGSANILPGILVRIYDYFREGESGAALDLQRQMLEASAFWALGTFPAAIKAACALVGDPAGPPFLPIKPLQDSDLAALNSFLKNLPESPLRE